LTFQKHTTSSAITAVYCGVYGQIGIFFKEGETEKPAEGKKQMSLF